MANPRGATLEQKMMGNRPSFGNHTDSKQRKLALIQGLNWHAFYFDAKKDFPVFEKFVKSIPGISVEELGLIRSVPSAFLSPTIMSLIKMIGDGWIASTDEINKIKAHVSELAGMAKSPIKTEEPISNDLPVVAPVQREKFRPAVFSLLQEFDIEEESWFTKRRVPISNSLDPFKTAVFDAKLTSAEYLSIVEIFEKRKAEYSAAYEKADEDLSEAYADFGQRMLGIVLRRIGMYLDAIKEGQEKTQVVKKAKKITKIKKTTPKTAKIEQQLKSLRFLPASVEYNVSSVDPQKVIGGKVLITFNTKTRVASIFYSSVPDGFTFKGTTLQGFDEQKSKSRGIRKPVDFVPILRDKTILQIERAWALLTTVERPAKGRINEDTLFLKVL